MKDYYEILGVERSASDDDIKKAYRNLAKKYHPDRFATASESEKKDAEARFKDINNAYAVLSDPQKKSNYDQFGSEDGAGMGAGGFSWGGGGGFDDIISNIFSSFTGGGGGRRYSRANAPIDGDDISYKVTLTFKEAAFGATREITINRTEECSDCKGTGAKGGTAHKTCSKCGGSGVINVRQNTPFGQMSSTQTCDACHGRGKIITEACSKCGGKGYQKVRRTISVPIPAGVANGQMMTFANEGDAGRNGGRRGNLIIVLEVKSHELFRRQGFDLYLEMPITFMQAALGAKVDVPTLTEPVSYTIPEGTNTGTVFRIKGKGIKYLKKDAYGDLYLTVVVETPKNLTPRQKELLASFNTAGKDNQNPKQKAFYDTLRKL